MLVPFCTDCKDFYGKNTIYGQMSNWSQSRDKILKSMVWNYIVGYLLEDSISDLRPHYGNFNMTASIIDWKCNLWLIKSWIEETLLTLGINGFEKTSKYVILQFK